jgi:thioredoxin reductase (NADPH)
MPKWVLFLAIISALGGVVGYITKGKSYTVSHELLISYSVSNLRNKNNIVDIAVLGSGPAGWSAALYGARLGHKTLVISGPEPGGQLMQTSYIENWPGFQKIKGSVAVQNVADQAKNFGARVLSDIVTNIDTTRWPFELTTEQGHTIHAQAIIMATGSTPRRLHVPGEDTFWGDGVGTCAICDAPFFKDKDVVVIGGGDSAAEKAMQLAHYAKRVTILVRKDTMRASHVMQQLLRSVSNVSIKYNVELERVTGDDTGVKAVEIRSNSTRELTAFPCEGVFIAIGHDPNSSLVKGKVDLAPSGHIICRGRTQETSIPGIFAAGDVEDDRYEQAGSASGRGIDAAIDADRFLREIGVTQEMRKAITTRGGYFEDVTYAKVALEQLKDLASYTKKIARGTVVVDFYTRECPSCMQMLPAVEAMASHFAGKIAFYKVDANQAQDIVMHAQVPRVPYLLVYHNGTRVALFNKALNRIELLQQLSHIVQSIGESEGQDTPAESQEEAVQPEQEPVESEELPEPLTAE